MQFTVSYEPDKRAEIKGDSLAELRALLADVESVDSIQVVLEKRMDGEPEEMINASFNANRAWMVWMNEDGDWLGPVNSNWRELEDVVEQCYIENGQLDEYEIRWSTPKPQAVALLLHYFERGERGPWVEWTDENYWKS